MDITFLGHSSFLIKGKKTALVCDPFDPAKTGFKFSKPEADIVTISHDHDDHNKSDLVGGVRRVIDGPGEYEIGGISIIGFSSFHDDKKGELRGKNTIYVIEIEGLRIVHLGDLGHKLSDKLVERIGLVDILMVPVGGTYTIDSAQALKTTQSLEPKIVLPMHYQVPELKLSKKLDGVEKFTAALGMKTQNLPKLKVKSADLLSDEQTVIILDKK